MTDVLEVIKNLETRLWDKFGNPLASYKKTHYVGKLMEELGHKWVASAKISGEHEDCAYYSEKALHDAFLAGQLLTKADNKKLRESIISELKAELRDAIDNMDIE